MIWRAVLAGLMCLLAGGAWAVTSLQAVRGQVQVQRGDSTLPASRAMVLQAGDILVCEAESETLVKFHDGARMAVRPESRIQLRELKLDGPVSTRQKTVKVLNGGLRYISGKSTARRRVRFETATATIGLRGTDFEIMVSDVPVHDDPAGTYLKVNSGAVVLDATNGESVEVEAGQLAFGGEPELVARGLGLPRRPAARKVAPTAASAFKPGLLDRLLQ